MQRLKTHEFGLRATSRIKTFNFQVQFGLAIQLLVSQVGVQDTRIVILIIDKHGTLV